MPQTTSAQSSPWRATVATLFPEMFPGPLGVSLAGEALKQGVWALDTVAIRDFGLGRHHTVDDTPAGGGAGMVMRADVVSAALDAATALNRERPLIYMSPRGQPLTQDLVRELAAGSGAVILAGRFEGVDERVIAHRQLREISVGDYVLSGGELAAMVLIDSVVRLLPGVIGKSQSLAEESFEAGLLEYPHYTRPRDWEGLSIPDVLLSGDHAKIAAWRRAQAEQLTRKRRPDLLARRGEK
jgi:tRNA (guanine37-N1)-methyltransferase